MSPSGDAGDDGDDAQRPPEPPRRLTVRRSPRYGVFIGGGALLGALVAVVLTFSRPASAEYGYTATLGYLLVALCTFGALLGATAAVAAGAVLDRRARQRRQ